MAAVLNGKSVTFDAPTKSDGVVASQGKPPVKQIRPPATLSNNFAGRLFGF